MRLRVNKYGDTLSGKRNVAQGGSFRTLLVHPPRSYKSTHVNKYRAKERKYQFFIGFCNDTLRKIILSVHSLINFYKFLQITTKEAVYETQYKGEMDISTINWQPILSQLRQLYKMKEKNCLRHNYTYMYSIWFITLKYMLESEIKNK